KSKAEAAWKIYTTTIDLPEEERLAKAIQTGQSTYYAALELSLAAARSGDRPKAENLYREGSRQTFDEAMAAVSADVEFQSKGGDEAYQQADDAFKRTRALVIAVAAIAALITIAVAWALTGSIVHPIKRAVQVAETVAAGDLTSSITAP